MINPYDKLVIGLVALLALLSLPISLWAGTQVGGGPPTAIVSVAGKEVMKIDLTKDAAGIKVSGDTSGQSAAEGEYCELEVRRGKIRVTSSTCENKICMRKGFVSEGEDIVCLPHLIVIRTSGSASGRVDALSY